MIIGWLYGMSQINKSKLSTESEITKKSAPREQHFFVHDHSFWLEQVFVMRLDEDDEGVGDDERRFGIDEYELFVKWGDMGCEEKRSRRETALHNIDNNKSM